MKKINYCSLIPTKSRPEMLSRMFRKCPILNSESTFVGIEAKEKELYRPWRNKYGSKCTIVWINNPEGIVGNAREQLRQAAVSKQEFEAYFLTDDNANFSQSSLENLITAYYLENLSEPCIVSGLGQPALWHQEAISEGTVFELSDQKTITTFRSYSTVHWVIPDFLYSKFSYPKDCFNDDVYFALWAILRMDFTNFKSCLEAKYTKKRFEPGGSGNKYERLLKMIGGMKMLAEDFPEVATSDWMKTSFKWKQILDYKKGITNEGQ